MQDLGAVWHVAIEDGTTQGPYTAGELSGLLQQGSIQADMLVWRDGWQDWVPIGSVDEVVGAAPAAIGAEPAQAAAPLPSQAPAPAAMQPAARAASPWDPPQATPSPRVSASEAMSSATRREGTVEIDLEQFRRLSASTPSVPPGVLLAQRTREEREDSGLIDVTGAHGSLGESDAPAASPLSVPSGRPMSRPPPKGGVDRRTVLLASSIILGFVGAAAAAVVVLTKPPEAPAEAEIAAEPEPPPAAAVPEAPPEEAEPEAEPAEEEAAPSAADEGEEKAADDEAEKEDEAEKAEDKPAPKKAASTAKKRATAKKRTTAKKRATKKRAASKAQAKEEPDPILEAMKPTKKESGSRSIDDLLSDAVEDSKVSEAKKKSSLPESPSRDQVVNVMSGVKAKVARCGGSGVATAAITVKGSTGRVSRVSVTGVSGAPKTCVEKAVRGARFPKFSQATFSVKYPFKL